jgi:hypothetical protein
MEGNGPSQNDVSKHTLQLHPSCMIDSAIVQVRTIGVIYIKVVRNYLFPTEYFLVSLISGIIETVVVRRIGQDKSTKLNRSALLTVNLVLSIR